MKRVVQKNTLSFSTSKVMQFLRTPAPLWQELMAEFNFTLDACASDENHLLPKYYTKDNSCLTAEWGVDERVYCHPLFDSHIGRFVKKCHDSQCLSVMLLPAGTHTKYFHEWIYKNPRCEVRFLRKPNKGFRFGKDDGSADDADSIGYIKPLMVVVFRRGDCVQPYDHCFFPSPKAASPGDDKQREEVCTKCGCDKEPGRTLPCDTCDCPKEKA